MKFDCVPGMCGNIIVLRSLVVAVVCRNLIAIKSIKNILRSYYKSLTSTERESGRDCKRESGPEQEYRYMFPLIKISLHEEHLLLMFCMACLVNSHTHICTHTHTHIYAHTKSVLGLAITSKAKIFMDVCVRVPEFLNQMSTNS